ncbi:polysaccharide pyruvyl transferase CsaB [Peptoniphilus asaccharolyticus DSM 20463]|uniref:Polysaccharide pyruvyl transferase CsaB n=1 Tax=Peptoniphilus asaccharolyticus DSM 20463 TaxID=573058 RepID=A0A1W1VD89_PEPAS|nr:polysaccharide pyruvyl transferase CsaB [Peptoniphilus asaccharolyticus]SMB91183.1 polysaccharide pyruvyl transferase CsaB [Peptoniphilus asaccharolyticus DSM 20463]
MTNTLANKILVSGYYGYNNIGDEAILKGLVDGISEISDAEIVVLSKNPDWTTEKYGVKAVNRSKISDILVNMKRTDMLLSGGGSLLQDVSSSKSILYYLGILKLAQLMKKKTFVYSQGIGPIRRTFNRFLTRNILNKVDYLNVRDGQSEAYLRDLNVKRDVQVTTDTVFGIKRPSLEKGREVLDGLGVRKDAVNVGMIVMNWKNSGERTIKEFIKTIELVKSKKDVNIILIPFFYHLDLEIETQIYDKIKNEYENIYLADHYLHVNEYLSLIGNLDICVSMRLHGLIFSTLMGVYPIGISYDPKIDGFMKELDRVQNHYVQNFKSEELAEEILESIENREALKENISRYLLKFVKKTKEHNKKVLEVLNTKNGKS